MRNLSNRIYDSFDSIHAERELKEKTKKYLAHRSKPRHVSHMRYAAAAAILLFLLLLGGAEYAFYMTPVAAISIDINPSMEWEVNRLDRVVSVTCYNEAAETVAEKLHIKHRKYDEAINELLSSREMSRYLSKDSTVNFSVVSEDSNRCARMQERAAECAGHYCRNVSCHGGSTEEWQEANEAGVSLGKYQAFLILQEADPSITLEEIRGMRMCQIRRLIEEYQAGDTEEGQADISDTGSQEGCPWKNGCDHQNDGCSQHCHGHHHEDD